MSRPSFQFYPGDWQKNANLRRCSPAARGVWVDVLCLLHDAEEYGVLRWPLKDIINAVSAPAGLVQELVAKGVLKGADRDAPAYVYRPKHAGKLGEPVTLVVPDGGPVWYSSRFVRDEYVRQRRGESTRFDAANQPPSRQPKGGIGGRHGDGPSSSSSPSGSEAIASDGAAAPPVDKSKPGKTPEEMAKAELWRAAVSVLKEGGCPESQCRTFMGKLVTDYGIDVARKAVESAVKEQPADSREYLMATCKRLKGERNSPLTVPSQEAERTAAYLAEKARHNAEAVSGSEVAARVAELKAKLTEQPA